MSGDMEPDFLFLFLPALLVVAFLYSSVGHGGASGYLALMALFSLAPTQMRPSALVLNLFVAGIAFYQFYRGGFFRWKLFAPFALASIPAAFIGAGITLDPLWYKRILGVCLAIATLRLLGIFGKRGGVLKDIPIWAGLVAGTIIGLFSGMIGIGGGIVLSPLILLMGWGDVKETAAASALFIFVNSTAGLIGLTLGGASFSPFLPVWVVVALAGGTLGAYSGSLRFNHQMVRHVLAGVLVLASVKLFIF